MLQQLLAVEKQSEVLNKECLASYLAANWLEMKKQYVRESTYAVYKQKIEKYILPFLGEIKLGDLNDNILNDFLKQLLTEGTQHSGGGLSWKTVSDIRSVLEMIIQWASKNGAPNLGLIKMSMPPQQPSSMEIINKGEQKKLEEVLLSDISLVNIGILLSLYDGLRIGEVCGLRWEDVDFKKGTLSIKRTVMRIQETEEEKDRKTKIIISVPKTYHSVREIPIPKDLLKLLRDVKGSKDDFVLTGTRQCMEPRALTAKYKRILRKAGISDYRYHALRHTFASRCIEQGVDIKTLSEIMGHSNVKITMDRYVHPSMEHKKKQINKLKLSCNKK